MPQTTYCRCVRITRTDGVILGFTSSDRDITIDGLTYKASAATDAVATVKDIGLNIDNVTISSILDNDAVTAKDVINGRYQNAKIVMAKVDFLAPPNTLLEAEVLLSGIVGKIELTDSVYAMEIRGLTALLNQGISVKASPICRWRFGDENCGVDLIPLTYTGVISGVVSNKELTTSLNPTRTLIYGYVEFLSGANEGLIYTVASNTGGRVNLLSTIQFSPAIGDQIRAVAGCKRDQWTCRDVYSNIFRFGGECAKWSKDSGFFPGTDKLIFPDRDD